MACMQHVCRDCKHEWFDNLTGGVCPRCHSNDVVHYFDELTLEWDDEEYEEDETDDEWYCTDNLGEFD